MLFGIILIIILLGSYGLIIWWGIKHETKESREPLTGESRNHYFVKTILDITDKIISLKKESEIRLFLKGEIGIDKSILELTPHSDYVRDSILGGAFGMVGVILTTGAHQMSVKIDKIDTIQAMWVYYLSRKINKDNMSKKEKRKIYEDIKKKMACLLNSKVLLLTNQADVKDAWMTILKDKTLTNKVINQLWGEVRRTLLNN